MHALESQRIRETSAGFDIFVYLEKDRRFTPTVFLELGQDGRTVSPIQTANIVIKYIGVL